MATQVFGCCFFLLIQDFPLHLYLIVCFSFKARAGVEMALIDAIPNSIRIPVWKLFGGAIRYCDYRHNGIWSSHHTLSVSTKFINTFTKVDIPYFPT